MSGTRGANKYEGLSEPSGRVNNTDENRKNIAHLDAVIKKEKIDAAETVSAAATEQPTEQATEQATYQQLLRAVHVKIEEDASRTESAPRTIGPMSAAAQNLQACTDPQQKKRQKKPCSVEGCSTLAASRGLCRKHGNTCREESCDKVAHAGRLCTAHGGR
jgi:hypothetical protein